MWSSEINEARSHGYEIQIVEGILFYADTYFRECVLFLFDQKKKAREEKNKPMELISKIMINSLYGFWATRVKDVTKLHMVTSPRKDPVIKYIETMTILKDKRVNETYIMRIKEDLKISYSYSPIAIATTALARSYLAEIMKDITTQGGEIYYCDTDSVITNFRIEGSSLESKWMQEEGKALGQLKNELGYGKSSEEVTIIAPKIYGFKDWGKPKLKGFYKKYWYKRKEFQDTISFFDPVMEEFKTEEHVQLCYDDLLGLEKGKTIDLVTWRFRTKMRAYFDDFTIGKESVHIQFKKGYQKGVVLKDGKIRPWVFTENGLK